MKTPTFTTITHTCTVDGMEVPLPFQPYDNEVHVIDNGKSVSYIVHDDTACEYDWPEGVAFLDHIVNVDDYNDWVDTFGDTDADFYPVGCYEHGSVAYTVHGDRTFPDMRWDYGIRAAIMIPRDFTNTREAANAILSEYSDWCNGETYMVVTVDVYDPDNWYTCRGFIGYDNANDAAASGDI